MYVTHDQIEAMTLADMIVVLKDGVIQQIGTPVDIYERPANRFVAGFLGSPSMNFIDATVGEGGRSVRIAGAQWAVDGALALALGARVGESVTVGVRPEHLAVRADGADGVLPGRVEFGEALGAETLLYVGTDAGRLVARLTGDARRAPGEPVKLVPEPGSLRVFDKDGAAVGRAEVATVHA